MEENELLEKVRRESGLKPGGDVVVHNQIAAELTAYRVGFEAWRWFTGG